MRRRDVLKLFVMSPFCGLVPKAQAAVPARYTVLTKVTADLVMKSDTFVSFECRSPKSGEAWSHVWWDPILFAGVAPDELFHVIGVAQHGANIYLATGGPEQDVMRDHDNMMTAWQSRDAIADMNKLSIRFRCQLERAFGMNVFKTEGVEWTVPSFMETR